MNFTVITVSAVEKYSGKGNKPRYYILMAPATVVTNLWLTSVLTREAVDRIARQGLDRQVDS